MRFGGLRGAWLALLFTLLAPLTSGVCSSLQGPFCKEVNGLSPPRRVLDDAWPGKGGGAGASLKEVNAKLLAALRSLKPRKIIAAFEMHGSMVARTGRVELSAGAWLGKAPKGWITVGLKGVLAASGKLLLRATDEQGVNMEGCSEMTLLRRRPRGGGGNAAAKIAGTWAGSYSCHGVPTKLELELQRDGGGGGGGGGGAGQLGGAAEGVEEWREDSFARDGAGGPYYHEVWRRLPRPASADPPCVLAMRSLPSDGGDGGAASAASAARDLIVVACGGRFAYASRAVGEAADAMRSRVAAAWREACLGQDTPCSSRAAAVDAAVGQGDLELAHWRARPRADGTRPRRVHDASTTRPRRVSP